MQFNKQFAFDGSTHIKQELNKYSPRDKTYNMNMNDQIKIFSHNIHNKQSNSATRAT